MKKITLFKVILSLAVFVVISCNKVHDLFDKNPGAGISKPTNKYPSDVVIKWIDMKTRIMLQGDPSQRPGFDRTLTVRFYAYLGIALYEAVVPGMPDYKSLSGQLTDMPEMPRPEKEKQYYWPASANTAMSVVHKGLLYSATAATTSAIDSLEAALSSQYGNEADAATVQRSIAFGREVAKRIVEWSETDGSYTVWPPYAPPVGQGLWEPTPPNNFAARGVHFGDQRTFVPKVVHAAFPPAPPAYSTDPSSGFYKMQKEVYDAVQNRTPADSLQATYWSGIGSGTPGLHWFTILKKVLIEQSAKLDKAALAYCKVGIAQYDATIVAHKAKYIFNLLRPVTYIRKVLGHTTWLPFSTPGAPNPDWPDGSITDYSASAAALSSVFGESYRLNTDGTNPARSQGYTFNSFEEAAVHAGMSRFLTGVTTKPAVDAGLQIGYKTVAYMDKKIAFRK